MPDVVTTAPGVSAPSPAPSAVNAATRSSCRTCSATRPAAQRASAYASGALREPGHSTTCATPPSGWSGAPASLPLASEAFLIASAQGEQSELRQVDFSARDLAELAASGPDVVQYSTYEAGSDEGLVDRRTSRAHFHELACS